ncbi:MarR family transcriptional regulator [Janthinobacterium lividum]|uniref:MarR family winged helix-turn-helix transcriptional regulator n=2 Tax=Oxalobacteraceae TaxID=75682 RepID=UPI0015960130|nr:MarR family transcriptional regulator [Janthinobacterium lividum]QKY03518.1 MarR family transcriptional regulator [Janthinobacterium lividum]
MLYSFNRATPVIDFQKEQSAGHMTSRAARLFARVIERKLKLIGMAPGQLPVFYELANGAQLTQKALTVAAAVEQPTMAATLARMERDGLVSRQPDPSDGRSSLFGLTPAALQQSPLIKEAIHASNREALAGFSAEEEHALLDMLSRIIANLDSKSTTPNPG